MSWQEQQLYGSVTTMDIARARRRASISAAVGERSLRSWAFTVPVRISTDASPVLRVVIVREEGSRIIWRASLCRAWSTWLKPLPKPTEGPGPLQLSAAEAEAADAGETADEVVGELAEELAADDDIPAEAEADE